MIRYRDLPGGYRLIGRTLRHFDAVMLLDGHTDSRKLLAHHTLVSDSMPVGYRASGRIPAAAQREMSERGTEGVWFSRAFRTVAEAEEFAAKRTALSSRRKRE